MRTLAVVLTMVLVVAPLTGCIGFGDETDEEAEPASQDPDPEELEEANATAEETEVETGPEIRSVWHNGTAQGGSLVVSSYCAPGCDNGYTFELEENATGIVVEAAWEADRTLRLDVVPPFAYCETGPAGVLYTECPERGQDGSGSPARVEITDPERLAMTGEWQVQLWPQDSYEESVAFASAAHTVYEDQPPSDLSKLDGEG